MNIFDLIISKDDLINYELMKQFLIKIQPEYKTIQLSECYYENEILFTRAIYHGAIKIINIFLIENPEIVNVNYHYKKRLNFFISNFKSNNEHMLLFMKKSKHYCRSLNSNIIQVTNKNE